MTHWLLYLANSAAWSLVGFAGGWLVASMGRDVKDIRQAVVREEEDAPMNHPHISTSTTTRWLGIFVAALAIVTVAQSVWLTQRQSEVVTCQARFNDAFAQAVKYRATLQDADRDALNTLTVNLYKLRNASEQRRAEEFTRYLARVEDTNAERAKHALPTLPGRCD